MRTLIKNGTVITMNKKREKGVMSILIEDDIITAIYPEGRFPGDVILPAENTEVIDAAGKVILPGFINGHIHADMLLCRGLGDGLTLHEQGGNSLPGRHSWFRKQLTYENRRIGREIQYMEALRSGTTYICDFLFWAGVDEDVCSAFETTGIDGAAVIDYRNDFLFAETRKDSELRKIFEHIRKGGYQPMLQGPSEESFDTELLLALKSTAKRQDVKIMLHMAETKIREAMIVEKFGMTPVRYLNDIGFLSSNIIGSHGVYIDEDEARMLADSGTTIVNSPVAEMKIADGAAPVRMLLDRSIPVGLGTDGPLWNDSANMFGEMKTLMLLQRLKYGASSFSAYDALEAATIGGARAIGMDDEIGSIEVGKKASLSIIEMNKVSLVPIYNGLAGNLIENIVSSAQPSDIDSVFVNGNPIIRKGEFATIDEMSRVERAQNVGNELFSRLK
ncbi:MAG: amidohydrolase family protein [Spirochaetales bacterium]|nr:amidohydrolase family protein [Spirochaetales bacterium]